MEKRTYSLFSLLSMHNSNARSDHFQACYLARSFTVQELALFIFKINDLASLCLSSKNRFGRNLQSLKAFFHANKKFTKSIVLIEL